MLRALDADRNKAQTRLKEAVQRSNTLESSSYSKRLEVELEALKSALRRLWEHPRESIDGVPSAQQHINEMQLEAGVAIGDPEALALRSADQQSDLSERVHYLKTHPQPFAAIRSGMKRHEVRRADRDFRQGDVLILQEFEPLKRNYTGKEIAAEVLYISVPGTFGLPDDLCVMSIQIGQDPKPE